jgi:hypothetical protein
MTAKSRKYENVEKTKDYSIRKKMYKKKKFILITTAIRLVTLLLVALI